jgi:tight adherence protein C
VDTTLIPNLLDSLASPLTFALLVALAIVMIWLAIAPARPRREVTERLDDYLERGDVITELELRKPLIQRTIAPVLLRGLRFFGNLMPKRNSEITDHLLEQAGRPWGMTALDYQGLRLLVTLGLGIIFVFVTSRLQQQGAWMILLRNGLIGATLGFIGITYWLRVRVRNRKHQIQVALPDALDMMTIGVEAGLAFESAMIRVGEKWHNPLTEELQRAVGEMRIGTSREEALKRMAHRCGVEDLTTFVAVLVQSTALGVSIAQVLHTQADQMRLKRRLRAEELARQAGTKMIFPLIFLIFPAMLFVVVGPSIPGFVEMFRSLGASGTGLP